jgi:hypothetical protein
VSYVVLCTLINHCYTVGTFEVKSTRSQVNGSSSSQYLYHGITANGQPLKPGNEHEKRRNGWGAYDDEDDVLVPTVPVSDRWQ